MNLLFFIFSFELMDQNSNRSPLDTVLDKFWGVIGSVKPALVQTLSWLDRTSSSFKESSANGSVVDDVEDTITRPIKDARFELAMRMFIISEYLNSEHKFISSLARSHPFQLIGTASIGFGLVCAAPFKAVQLPGGGKVFKYCTLMAVPATMVFTKLVQFKWNGDRIN